MYLQSVNLWGWLFGWCNFKISDRKHMDSDKCHVYLVNIVQVKMQPLQLNASVKLLIFPGP